MAVEFIKEVYEMDSQMTQQIPNVSILDQDIVRIVLHTPELKGLSFRDLELAGIIDSFNFDKYQLVPLTKEKGYKKVIRRMKLDEEAASIDDEIFAMAPGKSRFANKFEATTFEKQFE